MSYTRSTVNRPFVARVAGLIAGCTAALTLSFFGLVAIVTGDAVGIGERLPFYALGVSAIFVAGVVGLEQRRRDGRVVLAAASVLAALGGLLLTFGGEGAVYAARNPGEALASGRVLYLIAAGLIATGIGYWGIHHWRELVDASRV